MTSYSIELDLENCDYGNFIDLEFDSFKIEYNEDITNIFNINEIKKDDLKSSENNIDKIFLNEIKNLKEKENFNKELIKKLKKNEKKIQNVNCLKCYSINFFNNIIKLCNDCLSIKIENLIYHDKINKRKNKRNKRKLPSYF